MNDEFIKLPKKFKQPKKKQEPKKEMIDEVIDELDGLEPAEPEFVPPEVIAESDNGDTPKESPGKTGKGKKKWRQAFKGLSRKKKILLIFLVLVLLGGGSAGAYLLLKPKPAPAPIVVKEEPAPEPPKPTTIPSELTGVEVAPELAARPVTGVMIENSSEARPQSGLLSAGVVFEAIAEGGITRFLALYQEDKPDYIGPVRSARPYYVEWALGFDASYAHAGGSPDAISLINSEGVKGLNAFTYGEAFFRISERYSPHNLYTDMSKLDGLKDKLGHKSSTFSGFERKVDAPLASPTATVINMNISGALYNVQYNYDKATNSYSRKMAGKAHNDLKSGKQLAPKVVIALIIPYGKDTDGLHSTYKVVGSGKALVFQDGNFVEVNWAKKDRKSAIVLTDSAGKAFSLNAGQTWVTAIASADKVSHSGPAASP
jgi:Protein of unknown function (DUF3048) N-terminal domain/Protein of unknown function (DUF3048) C-terminal domain